MMYGDYPDFDELMSYICELQERYVFRTKVGQ